MMQAALFQLRGMIDGIEDPFLRSQIRLGTDVLSNAIENASNGVNAAIVNEIEFALNDVIGAGELTAPDAAQLLPIVEPGQQFEVITKGGVITLVPDRSLSEGRGFLRGIRTTGFREKNLSLAHSLSMADSMMLAVARAFDAELATTDAGFTGIDGVTVFSKKRS